MKIFKDRQSAGRLLAKRLGHLSSDSPRGEAGRGTIVLGIPRGGVVVAKEVARELNLPLDIIVTRKIGAPFQPELALGAVDADGEVIGEVSAFGEIREAVEREIGEIKRREKLYRQNRHERRPLARLVAGKMVILVDDGIATGATTLAAINFLKRHGAKKIILAIPVASEEAVDRVSREIGEMGEVVVLETPEYFQAVGQFYENFPPVEDEQVIQYLK